MSTPADGDESYTIAAATAARWVSAYAAQEDRAPAMLGALIADPRGLALAFAALGQILLDLLTRLEADGALGCSRQCWVDRLSMRLGAAADRVIARHRGGDRG
jgi:hypothetical protein